MTRKNADLEQKKCSTEHSISFRTNLFFEYDNFKESEVGETFEYLLHRARLDLLCHGAQSQANLSAFVVRLQKRRNLSLVILVVNQH